MTASLHSAIYDGEVMHHRFRPRKHRFVYRIASFLFDVDELPLLAQRCRLFSLNRFNLYSFYQRDIGDGSGESPRHYLEKTLGEHGIDETLSRASLLCYPRILGYTFNPLSVYFCYNADDELFTVLYEVSNTFGQRHSYLMPIAPADRAKTIIRQQCDKNFYVSPFIAMAARYHFRINRPGDSLCLAIRETEDDKALLHAVFRGDRQALNDRQLLRHFCRMPLMTIKVMLAIHWQAAKLFLKGIKLVPRPAEPARAISRIDP